MARASGARLVFDAAALPALDGALDLARAGVETGGAAHNRRFTAPALTVGDGVAPELVALAHDPQTSGGLLAAISAEAVDALRADLAAAGVDSWRVGRVERRRAGRGPGLIRIRPPATPGGGRRGGATAAHRRRRPARARSRRG